MRQARELHCGHAGLPMDYSRLAVPTDISYLADDTDFVWWPVLGHSARTKC